MLQCTLVIYLNLTCIGSYCLKDLFMVCSFCTDAVRMQYGPMRPHTVIVFQTLFVCLSLVKVPESRVTQGGERFP